MSSETDWSQEEFGYVPSRNWDANNCEFFIDGTFGEIFSHTGAYRDKLDFYFYVDLESLVEVQQGQILNVAACFFESDRIYIVRAKDSRISICLAKDEPWTPGIHFKLTGDFAFILDVRRRDGAIDRLWLKNGNRNFTLAEDIASYKVLGDSMGCGYKYYIAEDSPLFNQKKSCQQ